MNLKRTLKIVLVAAVFTTIITSCNESLKDKNANNLSHSKTNKMELKENKELIREFIKRMQNSDVEKLKTMITDDFSWWIIGKPEYLVTAGEHDKEYFLGFFKGSELFPEGPEFNIVSIMAEDNKVAAEATFKAKTAMGTFYENTYHFLFIIENGKVKRMKEYMDTYSAKRLLESIPQQ